MIWRAAEGAYFERGWRLNSERKKFARVGGFIACSLKGYLYLEAEGHLHRDSLETPGGRPIKKEERKRCQESEVTSDGSVGSSRTDPPMNLQMARA